METLSNAGGETASLSLPDEEGRAPAERGVMQLIKFCVVGVSSTVVDKGLYWILQGAFAAVPWWIITAISFSFGVSNGFLWNRLWTFRAHGEGHAMPRQQYVKFLLSNTIGLFLNLMFTKLFLAAMTGQMWHEVNPPRSHVIIASLCAAPIVVVWNFMIAKYWTFRKA